MAATVEDDAYPQHWKPAHLRKAEAEAQRQAEAQQQALDAQRISQLTSGADDYPSTWLKQDAKGIENA